MNVDYLHIGTAISGQCYADLLLMLQESIKEKRKGKVPHGVFSNKITLPYTSTQLQCMLCATVGVICYHTHRILYTWLPAIISFFFQNMLTSSKETFSALLAIYAGNSPVPGEFPAQRPVTRRFDVFFDLRLNKRLRNESWGWWFETLSRPSWRHRNDWKRSREEFCRECGLAFYRKGINTLPMR